MLGDSTGIVPAIALGPGRGVLRGRRPGLGRRSSRAASRSTPSSATDQARLGRARAEPASTTPRTMAEGPQSPADRLEGELRELLGTIQNPSLQRAARPLLRRGNRGLEPFPRRAGGEVLPPGLRGRAARAHPLGRPGGQRRRLLLPRRSTATSPSPARCSTTSARPRPTTTTPLAIDLTDAGRLLAEIPLGYYKVRREIEEIEGFDPDLAQAVLHIILCHHGQLEHGSPVVPCTREATLVHAMDNLGGKLGSFDRLETRARRRRELVALRPRALGLGLLRPPRRLAPGLIGTRS